MGYKLTPGHHTLSSNRKKAILDLELPTTKTQLRTFLGMAGVCRLWIFGFGLLAKPLYDSVKGPDKEPLFWTNAQQTAFKTLKAKLLSTPDVALPNLEKTFYFVCSGETGSSFGSSYPKIRK